LNVAEKLAREISRVTAIRVHHEQAAEECAQRGVVNANFQPAIAMMNAALEGAFVASGANNALATLRALNELEGFSDG
jgi:hypothetical protein